MYFLNQLYTYIIKKNWIRHKSFLSSEFTLSQTFLEKYTNVRAFFLVIYWVTKYFKSQILQFDLQGKKSPENYLDFKQMNKQMYYF